MYPRDRPRPPRFVALGLTAVTLGLALAACGTSASAPSAPAPTAAVPGTTPVAASSPTATSGASATTSSAASTTTTTAVALAPRVTPDLSPTATFAPVAVVNGLPAVWVAQRGGVTLLRFDQRLTELHLHAGSAYPGGSGWRYGDQIEPSEIHRVLAGFNGGFKFNVPGNGFVMGGRTAVPLSAGLGSIVTYTDGVTAIGAWREGVPAGGRAIASVRQNLSLLVDRGRLNDTANSCPVTCWGDPLHGQVLIARSGLGITAGGELVWAAGEQLTPAMLGRALIGAGAVRAVQLDINPFWVAGYLYAHRPTGPAAYPQVPGQNGIAGQLRLPDSRDFFTVVAR